VHEVTDAQIDKLEDLVRTAREAGVEDPVGLVISEDYPTAAALWDALFGERWPLPPPESGGAVERRASVVASRAKLVRALRDLAGESSHAVANELEAGWGPGLLTVELLADCSEVTLIPDFSSPEWAEPAAAPGQANNDEGQE
jgi:hypothetical protein